MDNFEKFVAACLGVALATVVGGLGAGCIAAGAVVGLMAWGE